MNAKTRLRAVPGMAHLSLSLFQTLLAAAEQCGDAWARHGAPAEHLFDRVHDCAAKLGYPDPLLDELGNVYAATCRRVRGQMAGRLAAGG